MGSAAVVESSLRIAACLSGTTSLGEFPAIIQQVYGTAPNPRHENACVLGTHRTADMGSAPLYKIGVTACTDIQK